MKGIALALSDITMEVPGCENLPIAQKSREEEGRLEIHMSTMPPTTTYHDPG